MMRTYGNYQKKDWELFFEFTMAAAHLDPNDKKSSVLAMEVGPVTATEPKFWKWTDQRLDATLGKIPTIYPVTNRDDTAHIYQTFWENLTKVMGSRIG